ncbi:MAG: M23 family metallopeptidase [Tannerellaceae bacterium]|jgi:murein DD-endopeptidase MepM/ murein hydrolase activator NlpD|nr:M23 family metallopeptidase [Tannerellaceae bacterium]
MGLFKSRKSYYLYDPNTLSYERVYPSIKDRVFTVVRHLSSGIIVALIIYFAFTRFFDSPMEAQLRKENHLMQTQYEVLSLRLNEAFSVLNDVQQRDENLYRAIFQVESIPESIRKAGVGGVNRYEHLMTLSNPDLIVATTQKMDMLKRQLYVQSNSLEELVNIGKTQEERLKCIPAIQPVSNKDLKRMASGYGMRIHPIYRIPKFHSGMDFSAPTGTDIYATGNGVVVFSGWKQNYGNCITIDHGFGYQTLYGHMSRMNVRVGQKVTRGETIGYVGDTGLSTGPHLHYEVIVRGKHNDPSKYYFLDLSPEEYDQMIQLAENHGNVMD